MTYEQGWRDAIEAAVVALSAASGRSLASVHSEIAVNVVRALAPPDSSRLTTDQGRDDPEHWDELQAELDEMERTNPAVRRAAKRYDETVRRLTHAPSEATDQSGRPMSTHRATCAGCSWCSPAYAAQRASEATACATCGHAAHADTVRGGTGRAKP